MGIANRHHQAFKTLKILSSVSENNIILTMAMPFLITCLLCVKARRLQKLI